MLGTPSVVHSTTVYIFTSRQSLQWLLISPLSNARYPPLAQINSKQGWDVDIVDGKYGLVMGGHSWLTMERSKGNHQTQFLETLCKCNLCHVFIKIMYHHQQLTSLKPLLDFCQELDQKLSFGAWVKVWIRVSELLFESGPVVLQGQYAMVMQIGVLCFPPKFFPALPLS